MLVSLSAKKGCASSAHSFFVNMNKIDNFCNGRVCRFLAKRLVKKGHQCYSNI